MRENGIIWVLMATLSIMVAFAVVQGAASQRHQNDALRTLICFVQDAELHPRKPPTPTAAQRREIISFWNEATQKAGLRPCQTPQTTVTTSR